jgi:hypothetical protein
MKISFKLLELIINYIIKVNKIKKAFFGNQPFLFHHLFAGE